MEGAWAAPGYLPRCHRCDQEFEKLICCERCKQAWYCSKECQTKAWRNHQNVCVLVLPRCHYCEKEFEKLLSCGRCKKAFYCSTKCQTRDWKEGHKNVCRAVNDNAKPEVKSVVTSKTVTKQEKLAKKEDQDDDSDDDDLEDTVQTDAEFRLELLSMTKVTNAKMVQAMQDSKGDPSKFLAQVIELREEYHRALFDQMCARNRKLVAAAARKAAKRPPVSSEKQEEEEEKTGEEAKKEEQIEFSAAISCGQNLMREVIMAFLQRGLSASANVDQLDIANNHFNLGIISPRPPAEFKLEDGDLDGFEPAVMKLMDKGFVCVAGLLDDDIATEIHEECKSKYWDCRHTGTMQLATANVTDGYESWLPFPPRKGTSPMLEHALRILFALPHEFQRNGYPIRLKVPTMAHLGCFVPGSGRESIHLDNMSNGDGGRELTFVFFCSPQWDSRFGGSFRAYMTEDDRPGPRPSTVAEYDGSKESKQTSEEEQTQVDRFKDFDPDAGTCLVFRSRDLWHEVLVASRVQFALTLFVQRAD